MTCIFTCFLRRHARLNEKRGVKGNELKLLELEVRTLESCAFLPLQRIGLGLGFGYVGTTALRADPSLSRCDV